MCSVSSRSGTASSTATLAASVDSWQDLCRMQTETANALLTFATSPSQGWVEAPLGAYTVLETEYDTEFQLELPLIQPAYCFSGLVRGCRPAFLFWKFSGFACYLF